MKYGRFNFIRNNKIRKKTPSRCQEGNDAYLIWVMAREISEKNAEQQ
jgi:hypothetical protein